MHSSTFWVNNLSAANMLDVSPFAFLRYEPELKPTWSPHITVNNQRGVIRRLVGASLWVDQLAAWGMKDISNGSGHDRLKSLLLVRLERISRYSYS